MECNELIEDPGTDFMMPDGDVEAGLAQLNQDFIPCTEDWDTGATGCSLCVAQDNDKIKSWRCSSKCGSGTAVDQKSLNRILKREFDKLRNPVPKSVLLTQQQNEPEWISIDDVLKKQMEQKEQKKLAPEEIFTNGGEGLRKNAARLEELVQKMREQKKARRKEVFRKKFGQGFQKILDRKREQIEREQIE